MNIIQLFNLKNKGYRYVFINVVAIVIFSILYKIADFYSVYEMNDPWYYWLYFSSITQTTVGYSGIQIKGISGLNAMTLKSKPLKTIIFIQMLSILVINGYFLAI